MTESNLEWLFGLTATKVSTLQLPKLRAAFTSLTIHPETDELYVTTQTAIYKLVEAKPFGNTFAFCLFPEFDLIDLM
jgi:hypothetical protein